MIWLLRYTGERRWNYTDWKFVRAPTEEAALRNHGGEPGKWTCERVEEDGDEGEIASSWVGDPG